MIPSALLLPNCSDAFFSEDKWLFSKENGLFQKKMAYFRKN